MSRWATVSVDIDPDDFIDQIDDKILIAELERRKKNTVSRKEIRHCKY